MVMARPDLVLYWGGLYENYVLFSPSALDSVLGGTFDLCPSSTGAIRGKHILMNRLGRIRVEESEEICHTENA